MHRAKLLDVRENFLQTEQKTRRFAPAKQGFLTKSDETLTAKATVEPMNTGSEPQTPKAGGWQFRMRHGRGSL
jgi:hypothetical protein